MFLFVRVSEGGGAALMSSAVDGNVYLRFVQPEENLFKVTADTRSLL